MKVWAIASLAAATVLLLGGTVAAERALVRSAGSEPAPVRAVESGPAPVRIGVILNYLDDPFFVAIYEGVRAEARRQGVRATVRSVTSNAEFADQAAQLRALIADHHDCYVVNPITATNLVTALRGVRGPIVNVDSPVDPVAAKRVGVRIRTYIGTDDMVSGTRAGAEMAELLPDGGNVAVLGGIADNVNSGVRLSGFERGIRGSRVRVVARVNADYNRTKAQIAATRILRAHPRLSGFFAVSDSMVLGVADALRGAGKIGKIKVIGHDGNAAVLALVQEGSISADVSQYPYVMGQMAVKACVAATRGARSPARVDAPIALLTKGNVARAIAAFPKPVERYSDPFDLLSADR
jgi:ABC-type sugar transport system substrate-binding protein